MRVMVAWLRGDCHGAFKVARSPRLHGTTVACGQVHAQLSNPTVDVQLDKPLIAAQARLQSRLIAARFESNSRFAPLAHNIYAAM